MTTTLGKVCDIYNGNSINANYKKTHFEGLAEGFPFIATKDVSFNGQVDYDNGVKIPFDTKFKKAHSGSVLICAEGGSAGRKIARIDQTVCFGNKLFCLSPKSNEIEQDYLYYYLLSDRFRNQFKENLAGLIRGVSSTKIKKIEIEYPNVKEQRAIVEKLNTVFQKIDIMLQNAESTIAEGKIIFTRALEDILGNNGDNWVKASLKDLCISLTDGDHLPPPKSNAGIPFITIGNVDKQSEEISFDKTFHVPQEYYNSLKEKRIPRKDDILYTVTGSFGIPILIKTNQEFCFQRHIALIKPKKDIIIPEYLCYWLKSPFIFQLANRVATGVAQKTVSLTSLRQFPVYYPKSKEQQKDIVAYLDKLWNNILNLLRNYKKIADECNSLKQAILKETFE